MDEIQQKNATRNMVIFFTCLIVLGSLGALFATGVFGGFRSADSVKVSCADGSTLGLLKNSLLNTNPQLKNASFKANGITTLSDTTKQVECRSTVSIENPEFNVTQELIVDYNASLSDDKKTLNLIVNKINQTKLEIKE